MGFRTYDIAVIGSVTAPPGQITEQLIGDGDLPAVDVGGFRDQVELRPFQESDFVAVEAELPRQPDNEHSRAGKLFCLRALTF